MKDQNPLATFHTYTTRTLRRLREGQDLYKDRAFSADPISLLNEIQEEILDICGWGYVLYKRLDKVQRMLEADWLRKALEDEGAE